MSFLNVGNGYGADLENNQYQNAGGLPGLLRQAMQQGSEVGRIASQTKPYSDGYGSPQGLLGRLLELQKRQGMPPDVDDGTLSTSAIRPTIPVQFRVSPTPGRLPWPSGPLSIGPQAVPQIPMPHLPGPWSTIGKIMQLFPRRVLGLDGDDDGQCPDCRKGVDESEEYGARKKPGRGGKLPLPIPPGAPFGTTRSNKSPESSGGGGGRRGRGRDNDDSQCYEREAQERANCYKRLDEYPHWDFLDGCLKRAVYRRNLCVRAGGRLDHEGPGEWDPDKDEEIYYDVGR